MELQKIKQRPRRNRKSPSIRALIQETRLTSYHLIQPFFVREGENLTVPIRSMPGVFHLSSDLLLKEAHEVYALGIPAILLFPVISPSHKDPLGSESLNPEGVLCQSIRMLKNECPHLCLIADVALDPYTSHGHDGVVDERGWVVNDETVHILGKMALNLAQAGIDIVAPSDMMDGRIGHIRSVLDENGYEEVSIMSYSAKYASAFYGPFRDALSSAPKFGDKKGYQMDPANAREAELECQLDEEEGADVLMIKPALPYLDVIARIRQQTSLPLAAYHVSGEYAMVIAADQNGWLDADRIFYEVLLSIKRAGADMILSYAARRVARYLITHRSHLSHF
jgi:porphobilinogen synthase